MYSTDVPRIRQYVETEGPDGLHDVITFVLATIRTPISRVVSAVEDIHTRGSESTHLWGFKRSGYLHSLEHKKALYGSLIESESDIDSATETLLSVPGLGLPKASFVLQCIGYDTACLDSHNLKRYGLPISFTKLPTGKERHKKLCAYINYCRIKGSEFHWNSWCEYVAGNKYNKELDTKEKVSSIHVTAITGL